MGRKRKPKGFRDRIKELRRVKASELRANPKNWRLHPKKQQTAMSEVLERVGFADALIAREDEDGLTLIDGHLRQDLSGDQMVPVLVLDVDEKEADFVLATHDPITGMAGIDELRLKELIEVSGVDILGFLKELEVDEDFSDLDDQLDELDGMEEVLISISVPSKHAESVKEWLANGERKSTSGFGIGVMKRCGLL